MKKINNFTFFFSKNDVFSNWYIRDFTVKGIKFNCGEQYMMYSKAMLFGDKIIAEKILLEKDPAKQKELGKKVSGFVKNIWDDNNIKIVAAGLFHKFNQNKDIGKILIETEGTELVEASPYDSIWGIKLSVNNPDALDKTKWKGENRLGIALTKVRAKLLESSLDLGI